MPVINPYHAETVEIKEIDEAHFDAVMKINGQDTRTFHVMRNLKTGVPRYFYAAEDFAYLPSQEDRKQLQMAVDITLKNEHR